MSIFKLLLTTFRLVLRDEDVRRSFKTSLIHDTLKLMEADSLESGDASRTSEDV